MYIRDDVFVRDGDEVLPREAAMLRIAEFAGWDGRVWFDGFYRCGKFTGVNESWMEFDLERPWNRLGTGGEDAIMRVFDDGDRVMFIWRSGGMMVEFTRPGSAAADAEPIPYPWTDTTLRP